MKIWLLASEYPPYYGGGIATYTVNMAQMLLSHGHQVTVITYDDRVAQSMRISEEMGIRVARFGTDFPSLVKNSGHALQLSYSYAYWTAELIGDDGCPPDVIEVQDYSAIGYMVLQRKWTLDPVFKDIPVLVTAHGTKFILDRLDQGPAYQFPDYWIGEMERFCLKAADLVVSPTKFVQEELHRQLSVDSWVVPNPINIEELSLVVERGSGVLHLGRMQYIKGTVFLLETLSAMWDRGWEVPLTIVGGDVKYYPKNVWMSEFVQAKYDRYIKQKLLVMRGRLTPREVRQAIEESQVVVIPSLFETFSYVAVEAMGAGRIVVASDSGGHRDFIEDNVNSLIYHQGSHQDLEHALRQAVDMDEQRRQTMALKARTSIVNIVNPDRVYEQKIKAYASTAKASTLKNFPFLRPQAAVQVGLKTVSTDNQVLSVVVPHYNLGHFLPDTIASLDEVKQKMGLNMQILVIDDGSDDPFSIATLYLIQHQYPYVEIVRTANQGLARARNTGAKRARGQYLAFLDADDMVAPQYYPRAIDVLKQYSNVGFVGCWVQYFGASNHLWPTWNSEPPYLLYHNTVNSSALVYRTAQFLAFGQNDPDMLYGMEDYESVIKMVSHGLSGVSIPEPWFFYRVRPDSMSRRFNRDNQLLLYRLIAEKNPAIYQKYAVDLVNLFNANGPQHTVDDPSRESPLNFM